MIVKRARSWQSHIIKLGRFASNHITDMIFHVITEDDTAVFAASDLTKLTNMREKNWMDERTWKCWEITWPFDFDARVVFRSADFIKYFIILSVNFEPFWIGLIMSASTVKGDRKKRDWAIANKEKFRDSTISREDIDEAIANGIKLAFKEQQSTLDSVVDFGSKRCCGLCADSSIT